MEIMTLNLESYGISHIGLVRPNNEDVFDELASKKVYFLADGMGGHNAGEIAAKEAVLQLRRIFERMKVSKASVQEAILFLREAFLGANEWVYELSQKEEQWLGMGTTLCCLWFIDQTLIYGHVGDSRIYRFANEKLEQLTQDHSLRQEFILKGYSPLPNKNIITRAIGTTAYVEPDIDSCRVKLGEIYFLCSDGLTDFVSSEEISCILSEAKDIKDASLKLVETAIAKGGNDNITVFMIKLIS